MRQLCENVGVALPLLEKWGHHDTAQNLQKLRDKHKTNNGARHMELFHMLRLHRKLYFGMV